MQKEALIAANFIGFFHFLWDDIDMLNQMGYKIYAIGDNEKKEDYTLKIMAEKNVTFIDAKIDAKSPFTKNNIVYYSKVKDLLKEHHFDVIHCHTPIVGLLVRCAARKYRKQGTVVIYTTHGLAFTHLSSKKEYFIYHTIEAFASRFCDAIITINKEDYESAKKLYCKNVFHINGVGVDTEKFKSADIDRDAYRKKINIPKDKLMILAIGELSYRKNHIVIVKALAKLAEEAQLSEKFAALYNGEVVNTGEKRLVLHHMTRGQLGDAVEADGVDKRSFYVEQQNRIADFANKVHAGEITNAAGEKFTTVVQIGIGGSDLGPRAMYLALENWAKKNNTFKMEAKFISNVDPDDAAAVLASIDVAHSIFVLVSKSGTTLETLTNESFVKDALNNAGLDASKHMIAVTSETSPLAKSDDYLAAFFMDDYIGGRFSSTSAVGGAVLSLAFGPEVFAQFLDGAAEEDKLSLNKNMLENPEMLDALIGVYERNVLGYPATAVLPYSQALSRFPAHLQQLDMESNGKSVNRFGEPVNYVTGPVIFGEPGTNGQHSFYQLLHQGTDIVPLQFIGFKNSQIGTDVVIQDSTSQQKLCANVAAQIVAFACGKADDDRNKNFEGGRPSSIIIGEELNPETLGALLAHFENKVMFQGFLWNINSFDQEGVQLGKVLAKRVLAHDTDGALKVYSDLLNI